MSGTGQILADPATNQTLSGDVDDGNLATATLDFGNVRVGSTSTQNFAVNNAGATGPALRGAVQTDDSAGNGGNVTDTRLDVTDQNFGPVATGSSTADIGVTFDAAEAGSLSGQQVAVVNNFDNVDNQVLNITGAAFNAAVAEVTPTTVDFGIVHVGDVLPTTSISISNTASPGTFSEDLRAENFATSGGVSLASGGSIITVVAGDSIGAADVLLDTSSAGVISGNVSLDLISTGDVDGISVLGLDEFSIGSEVIEFTSTVNNFANSQLVQIAGDGLLSETSSNEFLLDFGTILQGDQALEAELGLLNDVMGPADTLTGSFDLQSTPFLLSGFDSIGDINAGETQDDFLVGIQTDNVGAFTTSIVFNPLSENASGFSGALDQVTITVQANITSVPEPSSMGLILLASMGTMMLRRRRNC